MAYSQNFLRIPSTEPWEFMQECPSLPPVIYVISDLGGLFPLSSEAICSRCNFVLGHVFSFIFLYFVALFKPLMYNDCVYFPYLAIASCSTTKIFPVFTQFVASFRPLHCLFVAIPSLVTAIHAKDEGTISCSIKSHILWGGGGERREVMQFLA